MHGGQFLRPEFDASIHKAGAFASTSISPRVRYPDGRAVSTTRTAVAGGDGFSTTSVRNAVTSTSPLASAHVPSTVRTWTLRLWAMPPSPSRWECTATRVRSRVPVRVKVIVSDGFLVPDLQFDHAFSSVTPLRSRSAE